MLSDFINKLISILSPPWSQGRKHNSENVQRTLHTKGNGNGVLCVCVCVFIKLHITAQSGLVILVMWCICVCCLPIYSERLACERIGRGHTGGRSHKIFHPP